MFIKARGCKRTREHYLALVKEQTRSDARKCSYSQYTNMNGMNYIPIATMILVCIIFTKIIRNIFRAGYTRVCMWIINNPMVSVSIAMC